MLLSASRSSATLALHISEVLLFLFGVVLILGLLGEYQESEYWKKRLKIFELMVIIGVVGELWADGAIFMFSEQVQAIDEARVAKLDQEVISAETEAKDAYTSAGKAVSKAGEADERASANDLRAANLERENLEIRKQMVERGPRWVLLYGEQRKRLLGRVKPFAGQKFEIRYCQTYLNQYSIDTEAMGVVNILGGILKDKAQWIPRRRPVPIACSGGGIQIEVAHNASEATRKAAAALRSGLIEIPLSGIPAVIDFPPIVPDSPDQETVAILVFAHP